MPPNLLSCHPLNHLRLMLSHLLPCASFLIPIPFCFLPKPLNPNTGNTDIDNPNSSLCPTSMKTLPLLVFLAVLLAATAASTSSAARDLETELKKASSKTPGGEAGPGIPGFGTGPGGFFGPGGGFNMPGFGGGWGAGYGGPGGGYARGGVVRPSVVCSERGPCYKKRISCPAKCFTSYSRSGKGYGAGGGGGGCTIDCKKHCVAYC